MKKIIGAIAIAALLTSAIPINSHAVETGYEGDREPLLLEEVIEKTITNNLEIRNAKKEVDRTLKIRERASDQINRFPPGVKGTPDVRRDRAINLAAQDLQWQSARKQLEILIDQKEYQAKEKYYNLIHTQDTEQLFLKQQHLEERKHEIDTLKLRFGINSMNQYDISANELTSFEKEVQMATEERLNANEELNELMRVNLIHKYKATESPEFSPLGRFNLSGHIDSLKRSSVVAWLADAQADFASFQISVYDDNEFMPEPSSAVRMQKSIAETEAMSTKEQLENNVRAIHRMILDIEEGLERLEIQREIAEQQAYNLEVLYDNGMIIRFELDKARFSLEQIEKQRLEMVLQHELLKDALLKPWVMGGGMSN